jgi:site-specific recombinase
MQSIAPPSKTARHRERLRAAGLRPVQFWVLDTRSHELVAQIHRQCQRLRGDSAESDILRFTQEAATHIEDWR